MSNLNMLSDTRPTVVLLIGTLPSIENECCEYCSRGHIYSRVRPFYEPAVSDLDRSMHRSLWVLVAHNSFIEGSHTTKNVLWL